MRNVIRAGLIVGLLVSTTACSSAGFGTMNGSEHGIFEMRGDARGIEAWSQGMHGLIEGAKNAEGSAPTTSTVYMQKEKERTIQRINYRSPFERFFNGGGASAGQGS